MPAVRIQSLQQLQDTIINKADIIFTVSQPLYDEFKLLHNKVYLVPNGVDYESFEDQCGAGYGVDTLKKLRRPILGYLGMMHYKVDFHLLDSIAENHPKWMLLLMGKDNIHVNEDRKIFNKLLKRENVIWCKEITRTAIPCFLDAVDVCIVPLKKLDMNRYANYLKIWEYLAAGKPIVAINQDADLGAAKHFISVVDDKHGFERAIENVLSESDEEGDKLKKARIAFAKSNTWDHRVEQMMGVIDKFLKEKPERYN
jgi:glycosyltransferase involved in cell wall biosynthesis